MGSLRNARPYNILHTLVLNERFCGLKGNEPTVIQNKRIFKDRLDSFDFSLGDNYGCKQKTKERNIILLWKSQLKLKSWLRAGVFYQKSIFSKWGFVLNVSHGSQQYLNQ